MKTTHRRGKRIFWRAMACLFLALGVAIIAGWAGETGAPVTSSPGSAVPGRG